MKEVYNKYLNNEIKLEKWQIIGIICLIIIISGFFGWVYEYIFYFFNGGMEKFYWRGGNYLPWINIYATGALIILFFTRKLTKHPLLIFLIAVISTGILEFCSGFVIYEFFGGLRFWDYNTEILNFGNIGGYVCLRSVGFFGLSALLLMYVIVPLCIYISQKIYTIYIKIKYYIYYFIIFLGFILKAKKMILKISFFKLIILLLLQLLLQLLLV